MATRRHVQILRKGPQAWNEWRKGHPNVWPNLIRARLSGLILDGCDFDGVRMIGANFVDVAPAPPNNRQPSLSMSKPTYRSVRASNLMQSYILQGAYELWQESARANLRNLNFRRADLRGATLWGAACGNADFTDADLRNADLRWTHLLRANFTRANLAGANLARAIFHETTLNNTNLRGAVGLDEAYHYGPSSLDHRTLQQSGQLPVTFLRGCGLGPEMIKLLASLADDPIRYHSCFLSYSTSDEEFATVLHDDLQRHSVNCWFAPEDLKTGARFRTAIDQAIKTRDRLLLILSKHSLESSWVEKEVETAFEEERLQGRTILFPIRVDDAVFQTDQAWASDIRRTRHIGNFCHWRNEQHYQRAFCRLLQDLRAQAVDEEQ